MIALQPLPTLTVLSFSAGQDSYYILLRLIYDRAFRLLYAPHELLVVMSDTGNEHPRTLKCVAETELLCEQHDIPFVFITASMGYHPRTWQTLESQYVRNSTIGMKASRTKACTHNLKIIPIYNFLADYILKTYDMPETGVWGPKTPLVEFARQYGKIRVMIGIAADEGRRVMPDGEDKRKFMNLAITKSFPLVDIGFDRAACQKGIRDYGHEVPPPSNCMMCYWMHKIELLWLYEFHPEVFWRWVKHEHRKLNKNKHLEDKNQTVFGKGRTLVQVLSEAQFEYRHMTRADLEEWKMSHGHCVGSKY